MLEALLRRRRAPAHGRRRAARRVSVRRHRFLDGRRADAGATARSRSAPSRSASASRPMTKPTTPSRVATHLGTEHTELYVTPAEAQARHSNACRTSTTSRSPTLRKFRPILVSELTRRHVTVALSGDGGDEVFAGYNRYGQGLALAKTISDLAEAGAASDGRRHDCASTPGMWDGLSVRCQGGCAPLMGDKIHKLAGVLSEDQIGFYRRLVTQWSEASSLVEGAGAPDESLYASVSSGNNSRRRLVDAISRHAHLSAGRYFDQGGPRQHGGGARGPRAAARSPGG